MKPAPDIYISLWLKTIPDKWPY